MKRSTITIYPSLETRASTEAAATMSKYDGETSAVIFEDMICLKGDGKVSLRMLIMISFLLCLHSNISTVFVVWISGYSQP